MIASHPPPRCYSDRAEEQNRFARKVAAAAEELGEPFTYGSFARADRDQAKVTEPQGIGRFRGSGLKFVEAPVAF